MSPRLSSALSRPSAEAGTGQPATVNLYANHGAPFPGGDWNNGSNLIATTGPLNVPDQTNSIFNAALAATLPGSALEFVMEVFIPNGEAQGNSFFIGSNTDPETGLSYISSVDCGITDPTPTGDIGFPDMHIVFNVNGSCGGGTPTPTPTPTPIITPTPTVTPTPTYTDTNGDTNTDNHADTDGDTNTYNYADTDAEDFADA